MKKALVFGASGQMGSYLAELLVQKGYEVVGTQSGEFRQSKVTLPKEIKMELADLRDPTFAGRLILKHKPDEVYNMAAKMFAPASWDRPTEYIRVNGLAPATMMETLFSLKPEAKFFQAGSAEVYGKAFWKRLREEDTFWPQSPYGVAKVMAQEMVRLYRTKQRRFACTGIFFNAESPRRDEFFFASKVIKQLVRIRNGEADRLRLEGTLFAVRDWGLAEEYVEAVWEMMQAQGPADYVIATGTSASCLEFVREACAALDLPFDVVEYDHTFETFLDRSMANPWKIKNELGWAAKTKFPAVVRYLVAEELKKVEARCG